MTNTTARTRECINRCMHNRVYVFNVGPKEYGKTYWIKIDTAKLARQDEIWSWNMHRDDPHRTCECQYCSQWRDE